MQWYEIEIKNRAAIVRASNTRRATAEGVTKLYGYSRILPPGRSLIFTITRLSEKDQFVKDLENKYQAERKRKA